MSAPPLLGKAPASPASMSLNNLRALVAAAFYILLPAFVAQHMGLKTNTISSMAGKQRPTSYLDGLRGLASWFVFNTHLSPILSRRMGAGFMHDDTSRTLLQLPLIHLIHAGGFPIHLFFVINGFILSGSAVKVMDAPVQDPGLMMKKMSQAIFQRPLRLFLPSFASTFVSFILIRMDVFNYIDSVKNSDLITGWPMIEWWPARGPSFWAQLRDVIFQNIRMLRVLERNDGLDFANKYNPVLWTTPVQYQATLLLSMAHAATFFVPKQSRKALLFAIIAISVAAGQFIFLSFLLGWVLAEYVGMNAVADGGATEKSAATSVSRLRRLATWLLLFVGLYLGSYPRFEPNLTPGFKTLYAITPPSLGVTSDLWHSIGATTLVFCAQQIPVLSDFFGSTIFRYLGKISFGLYLTHLWSTHLGALPIYSFFWGITSRKDLTSEAVGFIVAYVPTLLLNLWVAEIWARTIEQQCTNLALWFRSKMLRRLE